jgi:amino acid transporter
MSVRSSLAAEPGRLRSNTIGLAGVLFQSITAMAPAGAVAFALGAAVPFTGSALPLAVVIATIVCVLVALCIGSFAKHLPSAGGYLTYVSHSLGSAAGWMTGWICDLAYMLGVPFSLLGQAIVVDSFVTSSFHLSLGWTTWVIIFALVACGLTYFGIKVSANTGVVLGIIEVVVFVSLSVWLLVAARDQNTAALFNPASSLQSGLGGWQGVLFGMIFVFLALGGFESSAPLAEEAHDPRRTVPQAILIAVISIGLFYLFCSYAGVVGWGPNNIAQYAADPNPWGTMAQRMWGPFEFIVILAIVNSGLGCTNANINTVSRVLYAMGRIQTLPRAFARVNRFQVPSVAILFTVTVAVILSLWLGFLYGPRTAFILLGDLATLPLIGIYIATCISVPLFYRREYLHEFRFVSHLIIPVIALVVLGFVLYFQFVPPPEPPLNLAGPIFVAWLLIGLTIVIVLRVRAPESLAAGNRIYIEEDKEA